MHPTARVKFVTTTTQVTYGIECRDNLISDIRIISFSETSNKAVSQRILANGADYTSDSSYDLSRGLQGIAGL